MNTEWAIGDVQGFIDSCQQHDEMWKQAGRRESAQASHQKDEIMAALPIVEQIADRVWSEWRTHPEPGAYHQWD